MYVACTLPHSFSFSISLDFSFPFLHKRGASDLLIIGGNRIESNRKESAEWMTCRCRRSLSKPARSTPQPPIPAPTRYAILFCLSFCFCFCFCVLHRMDMLCFGVQEVVKKGCEALHRCEDMVNNLGLFSPNETKEDISTTNLKYILVRMFEFSYFYF